jgi:hypothetical protein
MLRYGGTEEAGKEDPGSEEGGEAGEEEEIAGGEEDDETPGKEDETAEDDEAALEKEIFGEEKTPKELEALKKRLLGSYTKKMMGLTALRLKAEVAEALEKDPEGTILALAQQYGVKLSAKEIEEEVDFSKLDIPDPQKEETMSAYLKRALLPLFKQLGQQVTSSVKGAVEKKGKGEVFAAEKVKNEERVHKVLGYLNEHHADWGLYEESMLKMLKAHPTLRDDPEMLYSMGRADYLKGVKSTKKGVTGKTTKLKTGERSTKVVPTSVKGRKLTFNEVWERARKDASSLKRR